MSTVRRIRLEELNLVKLSNLFYANMCMIFFFRVKNVEAAIEVGIRGIHFKNTNSLREELSVMGIDITADGDQ